MQDSHTKATMAMTALVLALAAMVAGPAQARNEEGASGGGAALNQRGMEQAARQTAFEEIRDRNLSAVESAQPKVVIPYLSHGVGVDPSTFEPTPGGPTSVVVPYLSHGVGVDSSAFRDAQQSKRYNGGALGDTQQTARHNSGWYTGLEYPDLPTTSFGGSPVSSDDGLEWDGVTFGIGAAAIALLLALMTVMALRRPGRLAAR